MTLAEAVSLAQNFSKTRKCTKPTSRNLKVDPKIVHKWASLRRRIWQKKTTKLGQKNSSQSPVLTEAPIDADNLGIKDRISRVKISFLLSTNGTFNNLISNLPFVMSCYVCSMITIKR